MRCHLRCPERPTGVDAHSSRGETVAHVAASRLHDHDRVGAPSRSFRQYGVPSGNRHLVDVRAATAGSGCLGRFTPRTAISRRPPVSHDDSTQGPMRAGTGRRRTPTGSVPVIRRCRDSARENKHDDRPVCHPGPGNGGNGGNGETVELRGTEERRRARIDFSPLLRSSELSRILRSLRVPSDGTRHIVPPSRFPRFEVYT